MSVWRSSGNQGEGEGGPAPPHSFGRHRSSHTSPCLHSRDLKVNPEATLSKVLREKSKELRLDDFLPFSARGGDEALHDKGGDEGQLLGKGSRVTLPPDLHAAMATLVEALDNKRKGSVAPQVWLLSVVFVFLANETSFLREQLSHAAVEFKSAKCVLDVNSAKASCPDEVGVLFNERSGNVEYFGQVLAFYKITAAAKTYRLAHLSLKQNTTPSPQGLPRVSDAIYATGTVVEISAFTRKVLIVRRNPQERYSYVLTLRHNLPLEYVE